MQPWLRSHCNETWSYNNRLRSHNTRLCSHSRLRSPKTGLLINADVNKHSPSFSAHRHLCHQVKGAALAVTFTWHRWHIPSGERCSTCFDLHMTSMTNTTKWKVPNLLWPSHDTNTYHQVKGAELAVTFHAHQGQYLPVPLGEGWRTCCDPLRTPRTGTQWGSCRWPDSGRPNTAGLPPSKTMRTASPEMACPANQSKQWLVLQTGQNNEDGVSRNGLSCKPVKDWGTLFTLTQDISTQNPHPFLKDTNTQTTRNDNKEHLIFGKTYRQQGMRRNTCPLVNHTDNKEWEGIPGLWSITLTTRNEKEYLALGPTHTQKGVKRKNTFGSTHRQKGWQEKTPLLQHRQGEWRERTPLVQHTDKRREAKEHRQFNT